VITNAPDAVKGCTPFQRIKDLEGNKKDLKRGDQKSGPTRFKDIAQWAQELGIVREAGEDKGAFKGRVMRENALGGMRVQHRPAYHFLRDLEQAPNEPCAFWRYAAALIARHSPSSAAAFADYETDLRVLLRAVYCQRFDAPDDKEAGRLVDECIFIARICGNLPGTTV
jgi:hypothetical protein